MAKENIINVKKIAFTKLWKLEVYSFYNQVVEVIGSFDTKAMHIEATCDVLIGMHAKAQLLRLSDKDYGSHLLTPQVAELHKLRVKFAGFITNHMRVVEKAFFKGSEQLVTLVKPVVESHLNNLRELHRGESTQAINNFLYNVENNLEIRDALFELGFKPFIDELQDGQQAYENMYDERRADQSRQHKGSTVAVQREIQNMLDILFNQVDSYQHTYSDIDYSSLISQLNYVITSFTKAIKTRDTKRKNKKLKAQKDAKAALKEKIKKENKENMEKDQAALNDAAAVDKKPAEEKESPNSISPETPDKSNGSVKPDKPIIGLLDILKKLDKGERKEGEEQQ